MNANPDIPGTEKQPNTVASMLKLARALAIFPLVTAVCIIVATSAEDRVLQAELPGYQGYAHQVRFLLVPGIW